jgi:hypothetical protein
MEVDKREEDKDEDRDEGVMGIYGMDLRRNDFGHSLLLTSHLVHKLPREPSTDN